MFIQTLRPPVAGDTFMFNVAGGTGATAVEVFVGIRRIMVRKYPQLPCRVKARIPSDSGGETLRIQATDSVGSGKTLEYLISEEDPGAHSMLAGTR